MRSTIVGLPTIIGTRKDGRPIYLIQGAEDNPGDGSSSSGGDSGGDGSGSGSGDSGKPAGDNSGGDKTGDQKSGKFDHLTDVASLRALAERLDREAHTADQRARETTKTRAAAEAEQKVRDEVAKALGLTPAAQDPAAMATEIQQLRAQNTARDRELLVYRAALAPGMGVDVGRLTDSRSFMSKVDAIDPNDTDAPTKITQLIKTQLSSDQSLRAASARGASVEHSGGAGDNHSPDLSKSHGADLLAGAYAANASKNTN